MARKRDLPTPAEALETLNSLPKTVDGLPASPDPALVKELVAQAEQALEALKHAYVVDPKPGRRQRFQEKLS